MPHVKFKTIKPPKMNEAAAKQILRTALRKEGRHVLKDFEETTKTWDHEVDFKTHTHLAMADVIMSVEVETDDEIYNYVSGGTKPHPIVPKKKGGVLVFKGGYKAKTAPRQIGSGSGGPFGPTVFAKAVKHPGTKARRFPTVIWKKRMPEFYKVMWAAWRKAIKATGHGG